MKNKILKTSAIIGLILVPSFLFATISVGWNALLLTSGIIQPTQVNGTNQAINVLSTGTSTIANNEGVLDIGAYTGIDIGTKHNNAYAQMPSTGGAGFIGNSTTTKWSFNTGIVIGTLDKPEKLTCSYGGASSNNATNGNILQFTGTTGTSTTIDTNAYVMAGGSGIVNCNIQGINSSSLAQTAGISLGKNGGNGAFGSMVDGVNVSGVAKGIYLGSNTSFTSVNNTVINFDGQLLEQPDTTGANCEQNRYFNDVFADANNQAGGVTDLKGLLLQESGNCETSVGFTSIDDAQFYDDQFGGVSNLVNFVGVRQENPDLHPYTFIESNPGATQVSYNFVDGQQMNDVVAGMPEFMKVSGTVNLANYVFTSAGNVTSPVTRIVNALASSTVINWFGVSCQGANTQRTYIYGNVPCSPFGIGSDYGPPSLIVSSSTAAGIGKVGTGTSTPSAQLSVQGTGTGIGRTLAIANSNGAEKVTVLDNGNVGIGVTNPQDIFNVNVVSNDLGITLGGATTGVSPTLKFKDINNTTYFRGGLAGAAAAEVNDASANDTVFRTENKNFLITTNGGASTGLSVIGTSQNVGIATVTPQYIFSSYSATAPQIALSNGANVSQWVIRNAGGVLYIATTTTSGTATSSTAAITVNTNGQVQANCFTVDGVTCITNGALGIVSTGTAGQMPYYAANGTTLTATSSLFLSTAGTVGVGAASTPLAKFQVFTDSDTDNPGGTSVYSTKYAVIGPGQYDGLAFSKTAGGRAYITSLQPGAAWNSLGFQASDYQFYISGGSSSSAVLTNAGRLGLGTTTPTYLLNPYSATAPQLALSAGAGIAQWVMRNAGGNLYFATTTVAGTATTTVAALEVRNSGSVYMPFTGSSGSSQTGYWCYDANGQLIRDTAVCLVSARKFKTDIQPLQVGLEDLNKIDFVSYLKKEPLNVEDSHRQMGVIADDVAQISPALNEMLVTYVGGGTSGEVHAFRYDQFTALLGKSIQELNKKVEALPQFATQAKRSVEENWQDMLIGLLILGFIYQQYQIRKLKK